MQFRLVLFGTPFPRRLLIVAIAVGSLMTFVWLVLARAQPPDSATSFDLCGSAIEVHFFGETSGLVVYTGGKRYISLPGTKNLEG